MLAKAGEVMVGEADENATKEKGRKEVFKRTWLEQIDIKNQDKQINDELLRLPLNKSSNPDNYESPTKTSLI